jgi:hypothetical protein
MKAALEPTPASISRLLCGSKVVLGLDGTQGESGREKLAALDIEVAFNAA